MIFISYLLFFFIIYTIYCHYFLDIYLKQKGLAYKKQTKIKAQMVVLFFSRNLLRSLPCTPHLSHPQPSCIFTNTIHVYDAVFLHLAYTYIYIYTHVHVNIQLQDTFIFYLYIFFQNGNYAMNCQQVMGLTLDLTGVMNENKMRRKHMMGKVVETRRSY